LKSTLGVRENPKIWCGQMSMRQKLLAIPANSTRDLGQREAAEETEKFVHEVLNELAKMLECVESDWLDRLEKEK
jgi:hypothetical protein